MLKVLIAMQVTMYVNVHPRWLRVLPQRLAIAEMAFVSAELQVRVWEMPKVLTATPATMYANAVRH